MGTGLNRSAFDHVTIVAYFENERECDSPSTAVWHLPAENRRVITL